MGVPIFNIFIGVLTGWYIGRRLKVAKVKSEDFEIFLKKVNIFNIAFLTTICICSALIALSDPTTESNIEGMFGIPFTITHNMIWGIIIVGGVLLIITQYWLLNYSARMAYKKIGN
jgi:hypothetical protein